MTTVRRRSARILVIGGLVLSSSVAGAQQPPAQDLSGPAARRLRELITVVSSGSIEQLRQYIRRAYEPGVLERNREDRVVQYYAAMYDRTRGMTLDSLRATPTEAAALLRANQTGLWEQLSLRVEPEPPHRLLDFASFSVKPPKHPLAANGVSDAERAREIDRIASRLAEAGSFSGVVMVARADSVFYQRAFGYADRARSSPLAIDTRMQMASLTKTFVTVAAAQLVEQGLMSWEDTLGKYFSTLPASARERVRLRHLVTHTSGLAEMSCDRGGCPQASRSVSDHMVGALLAQGDSLRFAPGSRAVYTNSNYALLGRIIEVVSGQDLHELIRARVFKRAGMRDTDFFEIGVLDGPIAVGYHRVFGDTGVAVTGSPLRAEDVGYGSPWAGSYSTAGDILRFAHALQTGRLVRPGTLEALFSAKPESGNWGYGFDILDADRGLVGHGGGWNGISNSVDMFTRTGYTSVILSNYTNGRSPLREAIWMILP